jgi:hypothetical protein
MRPTACELVRLRPRFLGIAREERTSGAHGGRREGGITMISVKSAGVVLVSAALLLTGLQSAQARIPHAPTVGAHVQLASPTGLHPNVGSSSTIGAGYWVYPGSPNVSSASAQFKVPSFSCNNPTAPAGVFPGIWIYNSSATLVHQIDLNLYCQNGVAHIVDVVCIAGSSEGCVGTLTVNPGDRIITTFSESPYHTQGQLYDLTTHQFDDIYDGTPAPTDDYSVFVGDAGPVPFGFATHVPVFSKITYSKAQVDGYYLFEYSATPTKLKSSNSVQITTGALRDDGDGFVTTFAHT